MLVVEDHADTRRAVTWVFTRLGWHVSTVGTVHDALAHLARSPAPCCIILDLLLPDGRGETVLHRVRGMGLRSRVVVSTGEPLSMDELQRLAGLQPELVLPKPIDIENVWDGMCRVCA